MQAEETMREPDRAHADANAGDDQPGDDLPGNDLPVFEALLYPHRSLGQRAYLILILGTAIIMGKKGQAVWTGGGDEAAVEAAAARRAASSAVCASYALVRWRMR